MIPGTAKKKFIETQTRISRLMEGKHGRFTRKIKAGNLIKLMIVLILSGGHSICALSQVTVNSSAAATIVTVVTLVKNYNLDFGNLAVTTSAGTCILAAVAGNNPTRTITGGVTLPAFHGTPRAAEFITTGVVSQIFTINIPAVALTITSGANTMSVDTYTTDQTVVTPGTSWTGTFGASGTTFHVGATVHVSANQPAGLYTNAVGFPITVNYQ
jgi:hypothetical protein